MQRQLHCVLLFLSLFILIVHSPSQEIHPPLHFPTGEYLVGMEVSDIQFTPDNQYLLILSHENLYRLHLQDSFVEWLSPFPGEKMKWLFNNRYLIAYTNDLYFPLAGKLDNGTLYQWPSLDIVKTGIQEFLISADRNSILYKKDRQSNYSLFDLQTQTEIPIPSIPLLQFIGWDSNAKTITVLEGEWKKEYQGLKIDPVWLNTRNYETNEITYSVILKNAIYLQNFNTFGFYGNTYVREVDLIKPNTLFGVTQSKNTMYHGLTFFSSQIWDMVTGNVEKILDEERPSILCTVSNPFPYKISPLKNWLAASSTYCDGLEVYDIKSGFGKVIESLPQGKLAFSHDDKTMATVTDGSTSCYIQKSGHLYTLNLSTMKIDRSYYINSSVPTLSVFSPDDETLVFGNQFCRADIFNFKSAQGRPLDEGLYTYEAESWAFSPDGKRLVMTAHSRITQWDTESVSILNSVVLSDGINTIVRYSPMGDSLLLINNLAPPYGQEHGKTTINFLDPQSLATVSTISTDERHILSAEFSSDGEFIITGHQDNKAIIWDRRLGVKKQVFTEHSSEVVYAQFLADRIQAVSVDKSRNAFIWNVATGDIVTELDDLKTPVVYSPQMDLLFCGTQVWDLKTYKKITTIEGMDTDLAGINLSPSGNYLLTTTFDAVSKIRSIPEQILAPNEVNGFRIY